MWEKEKKRETWWTSHYVYFENISFLNRRTRIRLLRNHSFARYSTFVTKAIHVRSCKQDGATRLPEGRARILPEVYRSVESGNSLRFDLIESLSDERGISRQEAKVS